MRRLQRSVDSRLSGLSYTSGCRLAGKQEWMYVWLFEEEKGDDQVGDEGDTDQGGIDVPASKQLVELRVDLRKD